MCVCTRVSLCGTCALHIPWLDLHGAIGLTGESSCMQLWWMGKGKRRGSRVQWAQPLPNLWDWTAVVIKKVSKVKENSSTLIFEHSFTKPPYVTWTRWPPVVSSNLTPSLWFCDTLFCLYDYFSCNKRGQEHEKVCLTASYFDILCQSVSLSRSFTLISCMNNMRIL